MIDWNTLVERVDDMEDKARQGVAGVRGEAMDKLVEADRFVYNVKDTAEKAGYTVLNWDALYQIPYASYTIHNVARPKLPWICSKGHSFSMTLPAMQVRLRDDVESCGWCRQNIGLAAGHAKHIAGRVKYVMMHDERGEDMIYEMYENGNTPYGYRCRVSGEGFKCYAVNLQNWYRPQSVSDPIVHIAEDGERAFLWTGDRPVVKNPVIKEMFDYIGSPDGDGKTYGPVSCEPYYEEEFRNKKGYTHKSGLERAILECVEAGAKVLNIGLNPQYKAPGVYSWGDLSAENAALAAWIKDIEKELLDAKEAA